MGSGSPSGRFGRLPAREPLEPGEQFAARSVAAGPRVEHHAASERVRRRDLAHHEPVAGVGDDRPLEPHLPEAPAQPRQPGRATRGCRGGSGRARRLGIGVAVELELRIDPIARTHLGTGGDQHVAAPDLVDCEAGEVHRHSLPGRRPVERIVVDLHAADPDAPPLRQHLELVAPPDLP